MAETHGFDVAVVGGGISGLVAGARMAELGVRVVVVEKGKGERYLCNSRYTGGFFHVAFQEIHADGATLVKAIDGATRGTADPALARAVAAETRLAVDWLKSKGVKFMKGGAEGWKHNMLAPPGLLKPGLHWEGRGGDVMLRTLAGSLKASGGSLLLATRARRLLMDAGRCVGLEAEREDGGTARIDASSVVLCDGGFQGNATLLREFITPAPEKLRQRGAATGGGDALLMAREVGARLVGMDQFYGHLLCRDAMQGDTLWPYPIMDVLSRSGIVVDGGARRFMDEGGGGVFMSNAIARLADPLSTTAIFDEAIWDGPGREFLLPANPNLVSAGGTLYTAPSLAELARTLGLPGEALEATVAEYNAAVGARRTEGLSPPRTTSEYPAHPVRTAPFHAVRLCAGITYTMGGVAVGADGGVEDREGRPIPGLFAAGCCTGGLEGGERSGYVGGLAKSSVSALRVANHLAARRKS